ncbi:MAG: phasin family protein, partial [Desulfuromonadales bacterium]|nr:phasin family protein [Desulfuromonadales bacterium]NIS40923.1 phasin family protein [Desulfuromonadales bacterium]
MNKRVEKATDQAKKFGDDVKNMGRNVWLAGLGA